MKFYKNLYLSDSAAKKRKKIITKLKNNKMMNNVFLITFALNEEEQLDIIQSLFLLQSNYSTEDFFVVGIAKSQSEAFELVEKIAAEVYAETKDVCIRDYIMKKEQGK